jgi:hypothetical protein
MSSTRSRTRSVVVDRRGGLQQPRDDLGSQANASVEMIDRIDLGERQGRKGSGGGIGRRQGDFQ